jgi:hypothetical protein
MVRTGGRGPAYFEAAFEETTLPCGGKIGKSKANGFLAFTVALEEGPLMAVILEQVSLPSYAIEYTGDLGIVADPMGSGGFKGLSAEFGVWGIHRIVGTV